MSRAAGDRAAHSTDQGLFPKMTPKGSTVKVRKPSTAGSGLKKRDPQPAARAVARAASKARFKR